MKKINLSIFLKAYKSLSELGFPTEQVFERVKKNNPDFKIDGLKNEYETSIKDRNFDWVKYALETGFVIPSKDSPPREFKVDDLLIYSGLVGTISNREGKLTEQERERLSDQLKEIDIHSYSNIHELMDSEQFSWLRFATKHDYKLAFGEIYYTKEDIVYYAKKAAWDYLFPEGVDQERMKLISHECNALLKAYTANNGWMDTDEMVEIVSKNYPEVDAFLLTKVNWDKSTQKLNHFRNPIAMGFKRIQPV
jgi:hypothetical protein